VRAQDEHVPVRKIRRQALPLAQLEAGALEVVVGHPLVVAERIHADGQQATLEFAFIHHDFPGGGYIREEGRRLQGLPFSCETASMSFT
jgi:hypothetical protein